MPLQGVLTAKRTNRSNRTPQKVLRKNVTIIIALTIAFSIIRGTLYVCSSAHTSPARAVPPRAILSAVVPDAMARPVARVYPESRRAFRQPRMTGICGSLRRRVWRGEARRYGWGEVVLPRRMVMEAGGRVKAVLGSAWMVEVAGGLLGSAWPCLRLGCHWYWALP
jgi:hypothetical protein